MQPRGVIGEKLLFSRSRDQCAANWCTNFNCSLGLGFGEGLGLWLSPGHLLLSGDGLGFAGLRGPDLRFPPGVPRQVRVRGLGYGFGVRSRKVMSRDCALASDLVRADLIGLCNYMSVSP